MHRMKMVLFRCGAGLMEIVFSPDLRHGEEAASLIKELILLLEKLDTCKARMEWGELRVDANISVRRPGDPLGVRTEVKNLNSVRSVAKSIEYEVARQIQVLESGGEVENETRSFDVFAKITMPMRDKEAKQDYRFMPEPNLPPLRLCDTADTEESDRVNIHTIRSRMPELPFEIRAKLRERFDLSLLAASQLLEWPELSAYFFECVKYNPSSFKEVFNIVFSVVQENSLKNEVAALDISLKPKAVVEASNMRQSGEISFVALQEIFSKIIKGDTRNVADIVHEDGLLLIKDTEYIEQFALDVLKNNLDLVKQYHKQLKNKKKQNKVYQALIRAVNNDNRVEKVDMKSFTTTFKIKLEEFNK